MQHPNNRSTATLLLEDGTVFYGAAIGFKGIKGGELCFNTGMTGYQEIYTDPSYYGQIIINTTAHIGNYGVHYAENESDRVQISGLVCGSFSEIFSRKNAYGALQDFLAESKVPGIAGIDTRSLVRHIRAKGSMNAVIASGVELSADALRQHLNDIPPMEHLELSSKVSTSSVYDFGLESAPYKVAVMDYGIKKNILNCLQRENMFCKVFPATTSFEDVMQFAPDGIFLSNGPGDPASMEYAVKFVQQALSLNVPIFGICLGHQLLARAFGLGTYKMKNGHRGLNHPVKNLVTGLCEVTSQNHGFAVKADDLKGHSDVQLTHINLNDNTVEGIQAIHHSAFSVQYHPEASPGPHDSFELFAAFRQRMENVAALS
jgi:carbamoyl-phosphate synthase small subunit